MYAMQVSSSIAVTHVALPSRRNSVRQTMRSARPSANRAASLKVRAADKDDEAPARKQRTGFVSEDNSGNSNIFAIEPETVYLSSPDRDARAKEGLGGDIGVWALVLVVLAVGGGLFIAGNGAPDVQIVESSWDSESLQPLSYYLKNL
eukprot:CAMPEP_0198231720 /NCGR_PEP_ID=MMETSP1445-20131203/115347_1 /TAXON_ID=36898 /ORGANISM="Pyramimonas sp., Strain CCMP2087" /LENGTH=147 /DNA_ID=CAMNT_0043912351 /DNA_START=1113 /DNA_END=1556 /DNA_ORIENTATION=-